MKYFFIFFCCISSLLFSKEYKYDLAVCTIFQNDAKYLPEWIEFHQQQGVEHFYLYNNLSQDNWKEILTSCIKKRLVEIIDWPPNEDISQNWNQIQCSAYMDCIKKIKKICKWCAFIDTDEFLFSPGCKSLPKILKEYTQYGGVGANWIFYGTSWIEKILPGEKMLEKLTMRPKNYIYHTTIKSIVQPEFVIDCVNPHWFIFTPGKFHVSENKEIIATYFTEYPSVENLRINHYWTRDRNFFYGEKLKRYQKWGYSGKDFEDLEKKFNEIHDPIILDNL